MISKYSYDFLVDTNVIYSLFMKYFVRNEQRIKI